MAEPLLPPQIDAQDPLPDSSFLWRRVWAYGLTLGLLAFAMVALTRLPFGDTLSAIRSAFLLIGFAGLLYMAGATVKEITALLATLKLRLRGPRPEPDVDPTPSPAQKDAAP